MSSAYTSFSQKQTPQSEPIPGQQQGFQLENSAGGFVYQLDDWKAFERFLILGSEGGTYYVGEQKLTKENALRTLKVIQEDGRRAVDMIVKVSNEGRAPKNDPAIFALALAASAPDVATRSYALANLSKVCRIPTHLFHFLSYVQGQRGWGRGLKRAVAAWYNDQPVERLAYQTVKYQSRDGWTHADALRLSHPSTQDEARHFVYKWIVDGYEEASKKYCTDFCPPIIHVFEIAKGEDNLARIPGLISKWNLSREMLPTEALTKPEVWEALLQRMPPEAMLRNLGNMSKCGLLKPLSDASKLIVERLHDQEALRKARIHPIAVLVAMKTYASGHGLKGKGEWIPVPAVVDALDDCFYLCFKNIEPTGKRLLFGVDVSGSMSSPCGALPISCAEGAAAMALACVKSEKDYYVMGFTAGSNGRYLYIGQHASGALDGFVDLGITPKMRLTDVLTRTRGLNFGPTDCALPALWALHNKVSVDGIIIITDNQTWAGEIHPSQALKQYREKTGIPVKQVVMGMTSTGFTIADPSDAGSLDVVGFSTATPQVVSEFLRG